MGDIRVLLAGESWVSTAQHVKGVNLFTTSEYQIGIGALKEALADSDVAMTHMPGHDVPSEFPTDLAGLSAYDVIVLSDIGADSLLLHPDTFVRSQRTPNRLKLIAEAVAAGTGFMMIGGYYSFQGINGAARFHRTTIEQILPVRMLPNDDRVEVPEGYTPASTGRDDHPAIAGVGPEWPYLLGYNEVTAKPDGDVLLSAGDGGPLLVAGAYGKGRTMAWTSDIGPHWLPPAFIAWPGYAQLWQQVFRWLAAK